MKKLSYMGFYIIRIYLFIFVRSSVVGFFRGMPRVDTCVGWTGGRTLVGLLGRWIGGEEREWTAQINRSLLEPYESGRRSPIGGIVAAATRGAAASAFSFIPGRVSVDSPADSAGWRFWFILFIGDPSSSPVCSDFFSEIAVGRAGSGEQWRRRSWRFSRLQGRREMRRRRTAVRRRSPAVWMRLSN